MTAGGKNVAPQPIEQRLRQHPLVGEAMLLGDGRRFVAALIVPDFAALRTRVGDSGENDLATLVERPDVKPLYDDIVNGVNLDLPRYEQLKRFRVAPDRVQPGVRRTDAYVEGQAASRRRPLEGCDRRTVCIARWEKVTRRSGERLEQAGVSQRPPPELHAADDVLLWHLPPMPAIGAVVPVVAHHEVVRLLYDFRSMGLVTPIFGGHEQVRLQYLVHVDMTVFDPYRVTFLRYDPLDEGLVGVAGVVEHHDVAGFGNAKEAIGGFVDDQAILVLKRRLHALALDPGHLEAKCHDQRGVDCS